MTMNERDREFGLMIAEIARTTGNKRITIDNSQSNHKKKYYNYLNSDQWKMMRKGLFYERGEKCERCSSGKNLHIHHKSYKNVFNEKWEDLEILCKTCHEKEHSSAKKSFSILDIVDSIDKLQKEEEIDYLKAPF